MNYKLIHDRIIEKYRNNPPEKWVYSEKHHIIPRCMGGGNEKENIIILPAREHLIVHLLLAKIYGGKLIVAAWMMTQMKRYNSRQYKWLKEKFSARQSVDLKIRKIAKGSKRTPEQRKTISDRMKGKSYNKGRKASAETRLKLSQSHIGQKAWNKGKPMHPNATKALMTANIGKKQSAETIEKRVSKLRGRKYPKGVIGLSAAHIENLRKINIGNKYNLGRKQSPEIIKKRISAVMAGKERKKKND